MHKSYFYDNMSNAKKLFLLDAYALIYRAYFAFIKNPRINTRGINTSAIFGFANTLIEVIKKEIKILKLREKDQFYFRKKTIDYKK